MDLLKTILLYMSMLYISAVQVAPDPATANVTPTPMPTEAAIYQTVAPETATPVPTHAITANPAYGTLVMGDRGTEVGNVQRRLEELGYYTSEIDSAYGNLTRRAVEQFQYQNGLTVDGIAGKHTQTVLFEYADVKPAPTATPAFLPDATPTPQPATATPAPTQKPAPVTVAPGAEDTAEPAESAAPEPSETVASTPILLDQYSFVLSGFSEPLTVGDTDTVLHPAEFEETLYVPLTEILTSAGNIVIDNTNGTLEEIAFSVLSDFYQASYTLGSDGSIGDLQFAKNAQLQPLQSRSALQMDGVLYLPMDDIARITGISFAIDDAAGTITVTMPAAET